MDAEFDASIWVMVTLFLLLVDLFSTVYAVWYKGFAEANPLQRWAFKNPYTVFLNGVIRMALVLIFTYVCNRVGSAIPLQIISGTTLVIIVVNFVRFRKKL